MMYQPEIEQIGEELYFVAASPATRRLRTQAELLAQSDVPVLITGEAGSGKTTAARLIHSLSIRSSFQFMKINCAALTADLLESELFGHEYIGVNGRLESKPGKLEQCARGSVLLQDLDAMPASVQGRLLRALQTREFVRLGGQSQVRAEARVMAATRGNLEQSMMGGIHEDLYYHLSVCQLNVPPLRERREEIPLLLGHFMNRLTRRYAVPSPHLSGTLLDACQHYSWPGNLRQLEIFVKRFLVSGDGSAALEELNSHPEGELNGHGNGNENGHGKNGSTEEQSSLKLLVKHAKGEAERTAIAQALEQTHWNRKAAARLLNISYRGLLYKIDEYRLAPPAAQPS